MPPKDISSRRQFLRGEAAVQALASLAQGRWTDAPKEFQRADPTSQPYLIELSRSAMACQFEVYLNAGQYPQANEAAIEALDLVDTLEQQMTVYRDSSEIMEINRRGAEAWVEVEPRLFDLLVRAVQFYRETNGAFDITAGPLSKVWGFYRRAGAIPQPQDLTAALERVGSDKLEFDHERHAVRLSMPGVELNLGAIGKGYALDRCAEIMLLAGVDDFLWHGGQSSVLGRGSRAARRVEDEGWMVGVRHPLRLDRRLAELRLRGRALGTSGSGTQFFRYQGKRYGHILDPRTGQPAEGVLSVTVMAPQAAMADALSTAFYTLGPEAALDYCESRPEIGMLMLVPSRDGHTFDIATAGIAGEDLKVL
jgi:thiamine biosynthesis lipoprotein